MNSLVAWLPVDGWSRLMIDALWQSTLLAMLGLLAAKFLTRQSAVRAWILLLAIAACLLVPLASFAARTAGWTLLRSAQARSEAQPSAVRLEQFPTAHSMPMPSPTVIPPVEQTNSWPAWPVVLAIVWVCASVIVTVRLMLSAIAVNRLIRSARPVTDASLLAPAANAARRFGFAKTPELLSSSAIRTPMILALGQPRLLVPQSATANRDIDWTAAFLHELAHVVRRDGWMRLATEIAMIAIPLQPLLWLVRRELFRASEEACDDWAVAAGSDPISLAETLTNWLGTQAQFSPAGAIGMSSSKSRVMRLLALKETPRAGLPRLWGWAALPVALLLISVVALAQTPHQAKLKNQPAVQSPSTPKSNVDAKTSPPAYIIEPPDILLIDMVRGTPKGPIQIAPDDTLTISVTGTLAGQDIMGDFPVDSEGEVMLGPAYGTVKVEGLTRKESEVAIAKELRKVLSEPEVAVTIKTQPGQAVNGEHLVAPDGSINLGIYGNAYVSGLTISEARAAIEKQLSEYFRKPVVSVDVFAYNSKACYVIVQQGEKSDKVTRVPIKGNETVLDVLAHIDGLANLSKGKIFVSRPAPKGAKGQEKKLPVDWDEITAGGGTSTNYQILPGDRLFIIQAAKEEIAKQSQ